MQGTNKEVHDDDEQDRQGQAAMDEALALPVTRLFFGALTLLMLFSFVVIYHGHLLASHPRWQKAMFGVATPLLCAPIILEMGSVALYGKSRTPWFRKLMHRWQR